jgi:hypothetical protein
MYKFSDTFCFPSKPPEQLEGRPQVDAFVRQPVATRCVTGGAHLCWVHLCGVVRLAPTPLRSPGGRGQRRPNHARGTGLRLHHAPQDVACPGRAGSCTSTFHTPGRQECTFCHARAFVAVLPWPALPCPVSRVLLYWLLHSLGTCIGRSSAAVLVVVEMHVRIALCLSAFLKLLALCRVQTASPCCVVST